MKGPALTPAEVGPNADASALRIVWGDGHESEYAPLELRLACRCAGCMDEWTGEPLLDPERVDADVHPLAIHFVGRYALRFDWSDGHGTGIYPFEYLRGICPCPACEGASVP
jgi:ATP-binding protein involved in chromosome partitioning